MHPRFGHEFPSLKILPRNSPIAISKIVASERGRCEFAAHRLRMLQPYLVFGSFSPSYQYFTGIVNDHGD